MPDSRFYEALGPLSLAELARLAEATLQDSASAESRIDSVAPLAHAGPEAISFLSDKRYLSDLRVTRAGACVVAAAQIGAVPAGCVALVTPEPQVGYAKIAARLHRPRRHPSGTPAIHPEAVLEPGVDLGSGVVVGPGARIGSGTEVGANTVIGPGVAIGRDCRIGSNVSIGFALIGDRVRVLSGAAIGEAGFGVAGGRAGAVDIPQLGRVILQDGVSIGACTCIDRGAWDDTVVGENTKIDNLVQVAHNVRIGRNCVLAGHVGLSGSVEVGDGAMFGGRAGIADHLKIGARAKVAAASGVMHDIPAGEAWCGIPARPLRRFMRETAWLARHAHARDGDEGE